MRTYFRSDKTSRSVFIFSFELSDGNLVTGSRRFLLGLGEGVHKSLFVITPSLSLSTASNIVLYSSAERFRRSATWRRESFVNDSSSPKSEYTVSRTFALMLLHWRQMSFYNQQNDVFCLVNILVHQDECYFVFSENCLVVILIF